MVSFDKTFFRVLPSQFVKEIYTTTEGTRLVTRYVLEERGKGDGLHSSMTSKRGLR